MKHVVGCGLPYPRLHPDEYRLRCWHRWFAWRPVYAWGEAAVDGKVRVWWRHVWRKRTVQFSAPCGCPIWWEWAYLIAAPEAHDG